MKERILAIIKDHPGIRLREIAGILGCWNGDVVKPLWELKEEGLVRKEYFNDPANMDYYDMWFAKEGK